MNNLNNLYQDDEDDTLWNRVNSRFQDQKTSIKNKIWNNKLSKYKSWKYTFDRELDISLLQGSFSDLKKEIDDKRLGQDKYLQTNPFSQVVNQFFMPFNEEIINRGKMTFFKDFGFLSKQQKKKLGLCAIAGVNNFADSADRLKIYAWAGINDPVNNELSIKLNYYSPNLPTEKNVNNLQFKGRYQIVNHEQQEYLYQGKYQSFDEPEGCVYTLATKMYVNEVRGIDRPSILLCINRKSLLKKRYGERSTTTSQSKQTFAFDFSRKSFFLKSQYFQNFQQLYSFNKGTDGLVYINFMNNYSKGTIISIRQMIQNEKFYVNYQPGYVNDGYEEGNQGLLHNIQNTTKLEMIKTIPNFDPFIQVHSSFQAKTLNFGQIMSFKSFVRDNCKVVVSAGGTFDLGFVKVGLLYNFLDLIPYIFKNPQKDSFQKFQIHFSS